MNITTNARPNKTRLTERAGFVSIIVPNYNHARYVGDAIESALQQTYPKIEIIVVDDGSTDDSWPVISRFGTKVHGIRQENAGLSAARNIGIQHATGEYIALLDADDRLEPDYLSVLVSILDTHPAAGGVYCGYRFVDEQNTSLPEVQRRTVPPENFYAALLDGNFLVPESILLRRECYATAGPFDVTLRACEDWDLWLHIAKERSILGTDQVLTRHRVLPGSMSSDPVRMIENRLRVLAKHIGPEPANSVDGTANQRRAYGRAYLAAVVEYLQFGNQLQAGLYLHKMASVYPEGLTDTETFYELGCGDQPKGFRGHFATLDLPHNEKLVFELLAFLFEQSNLPSSVQIHKRKAFASTHFAQALLAYGSGELSRARRHLAHAVKWTPSLIGKSKWWGLLMRSCLSPKAKNQLRRYLALVRQSEYALQ
jgi:glycosyltransferase involved in cell wall biosynthesis